MKLVLFSSLILLLPCFFIFQVYPSGNAFAAVSLEGQLVNWGNPKHLVDTSLVESLQLGSTKCQVSINGTSWLQHSDER